MISSPESATARATRQDAAPSDDGAKAGARVSRVLFMDDDKVLREMVAAMLEFLGYETLCASDGEEATRLFAEAQHSERPVSAVILDLTVPSGMGGCAAVRRLREIDPGVRAVVSSGYANDPIMANYAAHGFVGVIAKPYQLQELGEVVRRAIGTGPG